MVLFGNVNNSQGNIKVLMTKNFTPVLCDSIQKRAFKTRTQHIE